jgi:hypothetical protein
LSVCLSVFFFFFFFEVNHHGANRMILNWLWSETNCKSRIYEIFR